MSECQASLTGLQVFYDLIIFRFKIHYYGY